MSQVQDFSRRLRVPAAVRSQALEYNRLGELKCPRGSISSSCLAAVCIELAATQLKEPLDKKQVQKLSGARSKAAYLSSYQTVEKLLKITSHLGPRELAVRLDCLEAVPLAEQVLLNYRRVMQEKYSAAQMEGLDLDRPLHAAAALYCACKLLKMRTDKSKFISSSLSARPMFQNVLDEMLKCAPKDTATAQKGKKKATEAEDPAASDGPEQAPEEGEEPQRRVWQPYASRICSDPSSREYLDYKRNRIKQDKLLLLMQNV